MSDNKTINPRMNTKQILLFVAMLCFSGFAVTYGGVRNGGLNKKSIGTYPNDSTIQELRVRGWICPDAKDWPLWWSGHGNNVKFDVINHGGKNADAYGRISGKNGYVSAYYGELKDRNCDYILTIWVKGKGLLHAGFMSYKLGPTGNTASPIFYSGPPPLIVKINSDKWVRYRHVMRKTAELWSVHVKIAALNGVVDFDEVSLKPANSAEVIMAIEEEKLYGRGLLIENYDVLQIDKTFLSKRADYRAATKAMCKNSHAIDKKIFSSLQKQIAELNPYINKSAKSILVPRYNDMIVLTRICRRFSGEKTEDAKPKPIKISKAESPAVNYRPGERLARLTSVTITDIRSDKVRYNENEQANTVATVVNTSKRSYNGTLIAFMHVGLDTVRELTRTNITLQANSRKTWQFSYGVGPETYGRGIEVRFIDDAGSVVDSWKEFYAVAAEWFRVQQSTYNAKMKNYKVDPWVTYFNQQHYFSSELSSFGVRLPDVDKYFSSQTRYPINVEARNAQMTYYKKIGINSTFYQTSCFDGQVGYENVRQHPEYVLYDANGQFAVDPVYGGYPNPMEIASPIETGKRRIMKKPYLDRTLTPWQHVSVNFALEDTVIYGANCARKHAKALGFNGVYFDGNLGIMKGYGYDGKPNVPSGSDEKYARLNARNHRIWSEILKKDDSNFGTWYNWHYPTEAHILWNKSKGRKIYCGSGYDGDVSDASIRAAAGWKNVMFLNEQQIHSFTRGSLAYPKKLLNALADNRDYIVQRYGANQVIGYFFLPISNDTPGLSKWAWPTVNYMGAQFIATQVHFITGFMPSWRPTLQFITRYSRFIWAPDVKVVSNAEDFIHISSTKQIQWKRLVYRLKTAEQEYLIIHLVHIPPTKKWDFNWVDEPSPIEDIKLTVNLEKGKLQRVLAIRPYYFEEEQQPVETKLKPEISGKEVTLVIPPFRYHTMIVFCIGRNNSSD